jgi:hypothetical protein
MDQLKAFEINYHFKGQCRHFFHEALHLCGSDALHFATLHAGVGSVNDNVAAGPVRLALRQAEGLGVTEVQWKRAT